MRKAFLRFGCFITGFNYDILKSCSEASVKQLKKYMSAMLIISIIWGFIGYSFASRYLQTEDWVSGIIAGVMVIIVVQIERQIILTTGRSPIAATFRVLIGIVMAIIGSVIIDQIIFKEDIEKEKIVSIDEEVEENLASRTQQIDAEITSLREQIRNKEFEYADIIAELDRKPYINTYSRTDNKETDSTGNQILVGSRIERTQVPNPKSAQISIVTEQIAQLRQQLSGKEEARMNIRKELEEELLSKTAFLDEITLFTKLLLSSPVALVIWALIFFFFLSLELFVIVSKMGDEKNDYDKVILHQVAVRRGILEELGRKRVG